MAAAMTPPDNETLSGILAQLDETHTSYFACARRLEKLPTGTLALEARVGVVSTFTFELVRPYLTVEGAKRGVAVSLTCAPFGQLEQQVLDASSELLSSKPSVVVMAIRLEDLDPSLADGFGSLSAADVDAKVAAHVARVANLVERLRVHSSAQIVVWNQAPLARVSAGLADAQLELSQASMVARVNERLRAALAGPGVTLFDAHRLAIEVGTRRWFDTKLALLGRAPFTGEGQLALGKALARHVAALLRPPCKCLVLDLDNTLWGGVLGEDGLGGIALGDDFPGNAYKAFQRAVLSYRDRGILLAIASKNTEAEVADAFAKHAELLIKWDDFAAKQVHWNDKATSLRQIAADLNIGVDALAFFDDNPAERDWVRAQLPTVKVIDVPKDPARYVAALDDSGVFDQLSVTAEDRERAAQYRTEALRKEHQARAGSVEEFLKELEMTVTVGTIDGDHMARAAQLLAKTNQFNVTTRRHGEGELANMLATGAIGLWARVADRYGDAGVVGLAIAKPSVEGAFEIDSFLLSCRVLGRHVERALLAELARRARDRGAAELTGEFIPTKKNAPAATFFADVGFEPAGENRWRITLADGSPASPSFINVVKVP